jgi:hypothetical protein
MTCIVGMIDNGKVTIGADSAGVSGLDITIRKDPKVFINGEFVIGCTSSFRMIQLLQFSLTVPKQTAEQDDFEFMCTTFIDSVRKCFKKGGYLQKYTDGDDKGGSFLVGYNGRLYRIDDDFQVGESMNDYDSVGCGEEYAKGSLCTTEDMELSITERIEKALYVASQKSGGVSPPFILKTK